MYVRVWKLRNLTLSWSWIGIELGNALFNSSFWMIFFNFWLAHITIQRVKLVRSWIRRTFAIRTDSSETVANKMILNFHRRIRTSWLVVNSTEITVIVFRKNLFRISEVRTQNCFILVCFYFDERSRERLFTNSTQPPTRRALEISNQNKSENW